MYAHVTAWGWFWIIWSGVGAVVELYWVFVNAANTLSRQIWAVESLNLAHPLRFSDWTWLHWLIASDLWTFFAWLSVHFPFGFIRLAGMPWPMSSSLSGFSSRRVTV